MVRIKKIKCPRCREQFDPVADVIITAEEHCAHPKCGLEQVNLSKLQKNLNSGYHLFKQDEPKEDLIELDFEEPMVIHVIDADNKYVE